MNSRCDIIRQKIKELKIWTDFMSRRLKITLIIIIYMYSIETVGDGRRDNCVTVEIGKNLLDKMERTRYQLYIIMFIN